MDNSGSQGRHMKRKVGNRAVDNIEKVMDSKSSNDETTTSVGADPSSVEAMLISKMAEIQMTAKRSDKLHVMDRIRNINSVTVLTDESQMCREFDSEVIDERKSSEDRIKQVRELYINKIRKVILLKAEDENAEKSCKSLIDEKRTILEELSLIRKEKDSVEGIKSKLQELCRLLQKQNKDISENTQKISSLENEKLEELSSKFNTTISDVTSKMEDHDKEQMTQIEENKSLEEKTKQFQNHFILKEEHYNTQIRAKTLEIQLLEAKYEQSVNIVDHERAKAIATKAEVDKMTISEKELKIQVKLYADKFETFEDAVNKSNTMFKQFQERTDKMTSTIKKLEKQKSRLERSITRHQVEQQQAVEATPQVEQQLVSLLEEKKEIEIICRSLQKTRIDVSNLLSRLLPEEKKVEEVVPTTNSTLDSTDTKCIDEEENHENDVNNSSNSNSNNDTKEIVVESEGNNDVDVADKGVDLIDTAGENKIGDVDNEVEVEDEDDSSHIMTMLALHSHPRIALFIEVVSFFKFALIGSFWLSTFLLKPVLAHSGSFKL
eukprot:gene6840-13856_t